MKYDAKIQTADGRIGKFHYEKSFSLGATPVLCGITGILAGGYCWVYMRMPSESQENHMIQEAHLKLDEILQGKPYEVVTSRTEQKNWNQMEDIQYFDLVPLAK